MSGRWRDDLRAGWAEAAWVTRFLAALLPFALVAGFLLAAWERFR